MPKRGERATARVRFRWTHGPHGTIPCYMQGQAAAELDKLREVAQRRGFEVEVAVDRRDDAGAWVEVGRATYPSAP